jgi:hypothetical protein
LQHACILREDFTSFSLVGTRRCYLAATRRDKAIIIIEQYAMGRTIQIVKLTGLQGP